MCRLLRDQQVHHIVNRLLSSGGCRMYTHFWLDLVRQVSRTIAQGRHRYVANSLEEAPFGAEPLVQLGKVHAYSVGVSAGVQTGCARFSRPGYSLQSYVFRGLTADLHGECRAQIVVICSEESLPYAGVSLQSVPAYWPLARPRRP